MLQYSKLYGLLTNRGLKKGLVNFGLRCTIHDLYSRGGVLRYIYFETEIKTPCLLYINPAVFEIKNDVSKKFNEITRWKGPDESLNTIITTDENIPIIPEIKTTTSPEPFINLINVIAPSTKSIPYKVGILLEEYLLVQIDDEIDVFIVRGSKEPKLLVVVDLTTLLNDASTTRIERVYTSLNKVLYDNCDQYWVNLHSLLLECQKLKIITNGKQSIDNIVVRAAQLQSSHFAINTALKSLSMTLEKRP